MKIVKYFVTIYVFFFYLSGCKDKYEIDPEHLEGSKWKLLGLVDKRNGDIIKLEPQKCTDCYTLIFDTDSTAFYHCIPNSTPLQEWHKINLYNLEPGQYGDWLLCVQWDKDGKSYCDVTAFHKAMGHAESYSVTRKELRLFLHNYNYYDYLLFKPIKP